MQERNKTEKRLFFFFFKATDSSEISTTETVSYNLLVPQCPHPASKTAFWARSYLPLYFPVMNVMPFGVTAHLVHKNYYLVNQWRLQALSEALTYTAPTLWLHTHVVKNLCIRFLMLKAQTSPLGICIPLPWSPFPSSSNKHTRSQQDLSCFTEQKAS